MTAPIEVEGSAAQAQPEAVLAGLDKKAIEGRSLGQIAWLRLKRDKVAIISAGVLVFLIVVALCAPLITKLTGNPPNEFNTSLLDPTYQTPKGAFGGVSGSHLFGVEPVNGRDILSRIVYGARVSLLVAFLATVVQVVLGVLLGVIAGFVGGWVDTLINGLMNIMLGFPLLLFAIALISVAVDFPRIALLVLVIGGFNWPYVARIVRGQVLSLREKEFVDAARSLGAGGNRIMFKEILPNLVGPILVYSTLIIPTNILFEAALSFLGVGVRPPTASWGAMLSTASQGFFQIDPMFMVVPGLAIFVTVLAFNLFGDGLRDALDPRSGR